MRRIKWGVAVCMVVLFACAKNEEVETTADETAAATPAPAPAPAPAAPAQAVEMPAGVTAEMVTGGQQIFASTGNCFTCHGPDAKGTALAPNLTDAEWLNNDGTYDAIINTVKTGVATPKKFTAAMPAMGGAQLTDDQVKQVAAYVWSLGGGK